jgi:hypothetical protein
MNTPVPTNKEIKNEADDILFNKGIDVLLKKYGQPYYSGSYAMDLMTWRDLDIYLQVKHLDLAPFYDLGKEAGLLLKPVKMTFRNETIVHTPGLPNGFYWGIYLGNERKGSWKIDIWMMEEDECQKRVQWCEQLASKMSKEQKEIIIDIKSQCWEDPHYRKNFHSTDIYDGVMKHGIRNISEFREFLHHHKK